MSFVVWIVFGLITGIVANLIDPYPSSGGTVGAVVLGIAGAVIGGVVSNLFFGVGITGFNFTSFVVSILGALLMLFIGRAFRSA